MLTSIFPRVYGVDLRFFCCVCKPDWSFFCHIFCSTTSTIFHVCYFWFQFHASSSSIHWGKHSTICPVVLRRTVSVDSLFGASKWNQAGWKEDISLQADGYSLVSVSQYAMICRVVHNGPRLWNNILYLAILYRIVQVRWVPERCQNFWVSALPKRVKRCNERLDLLTPKYKPVLHNAELSSPRLILTFIL